MQNLYYTESAYGSLKLLTPTWFDSLLNSPRQAELIAKIRASHDEDEQARLKKQMVAVCFLGSLDEKLAQRALGSKEAMRKTLGKEVKTNRQQQLMKPTGLFVVDCDAHLPLGATTEERENWAKKAYDILIEALNANNQQERLVYADRSARGGLHAVMTGRQGSTPEKDIEWVAQMTEGKLPIDRVVTDFSRLLFLGDSVFFVNKEALFGCNNEAGYVNEEYLGGVSSEKCGVSSELHTKYKGVPYTTIYSHLVDLLGGEPCEGARNNFVLMAASLLRHICDDNADWLMQIIPTYGLPRDEWEKTIRQAAGFKKNSPYMPKLLKQAINLASSEQCVVSSEPTDNIANGGEASLHTTHYTLHTKNLPIGIKDSLENLPEAMQMPILASLLPLMGAYAYGVKARYADGKMHPLALMSIVVGEMASGKSQCKDIADVWLEKMREQDAEQRRLEREWREQNKGRKANEKGKPDPEVTIVEVPITISCSTLLKRLMYARGRILYSFDEELDTLRKTNTAGNWSAKYDIYRKAFDHSMWGQDYNSDQATSGMAKVAYNFSILGTYGAFRKCFRGESVENGLASRILIAEMPDNRFAKLKRQKQLDEKQRENIQKAVETLRSAKGELEVPKLRYMMEEWVEDKRIEALKNADDLKDAFRKRAAVIGFRAGVIYFLLENKSEECGVMSDNCCRFAQMIAQYTLDEQMRLFGEQFVEASEENERGAYGTGNQDLLDSLPKVFTVKDIQKVKGTSCSKFTIYSIIRRWIDNKLVKKESSHAWAIV